MTAEPSVLSIDDTTDWHADELPTIDFVLHNCIDTDWLRDAPSHFDVRHEETARLYATNMGVSPSILTGIPAGAAQESIPIGYTNLYLLEKRAVIVDGRLVRVWPQRFEPERKFHDGGFSSLTEGSRFSHLELGLDRWINHSIGKAMTLSARMGGAPVLVVRTLTEQFWH